MNKLKKGFTLLELIIAIVIIAIISGISIPAFATVFENAKESADIQLLTQINNVLKLGKIDGSIKDTNDIYEVLELNGFHKDELVSKRDGYQFVYNKEINEFELLQDGWQDYGTISATAWRELFNVTESNSFQGYKGFKTYTDKTTYTYQYIKTAVNNDTGYHDVIVGDTITEKNSLIYWLHVPENYDSRISYPLYTYIHGSGGCLFYQNAFGVRTITSIDVGSSSYELNMIINGSGTTNNCAYYLDGSIGKGCAFGGDWDEGFISMWFNHIKDHPEDDGFFIYVQMSDELFFENPATYNIGGVTCNQLSIYNAYKAGPEYGVQNASSYYNVTYNSKKLGANVWWQLLTKLQDKLMNEYNIDSKELYMCGASLGGQSTFDILAHYPNRYKAAFPCVPVATDISDDVISGTKNTKIVCIVGASSANSNDGCVSTKPCEDFITKLKNIGGSGEVIYAGGGHGTNGYKIENNFNKILNVIHS